MEHAQVKETRMLYSTSPSGKTRTYKLNNLRFDITTVNLASRRLVRRDICNLKEPNHPE